MKREGRIACIMRTERQCAAKDRTGEEKIKRTMNRQRAFALYEILAWMHDCRVLYAYFMNIYDHNNG
jgi:hypothetical protein